MARKQGAVTNKHRNDPQKWIMLETRGGDRLHTAETPHRLLQRINEVATRLGLDPLPLEVA